MAGSLSNVNDTFQSETTALVNAIQAADQMGIGRVIFETDCVNLKTGMTTTTYDSSSLGFLVSNMKF
jgi:ribonuclease HI